MDYILILPDEAFFNLITISSLDTVIELQNTYYEDRKKVFDMSRKVVAKELDLPPDFSFEQMREYENRKESWEKIDFLLSQGDFPEYVLALANDDEEYMQDLLVQSVINYKRDETSLILLLNFEDEEESSYFFIEALECNLLKTTEYLLTKLDPEETIYSQVFRGETWLSKNGFLWLLENFNFPIHSEFISAYTSFTRVSVKILELLLSKSSTKDRKKACEQHLIFLETGYSLHGGDYLVDKNKKEIEEITSLFEKWSC